MIRVFAATAENIGETQANQLVNQWLEDNTPWTDDPTPHEVRKTQAGIDGAGTEYFVGSVRFEFSDDKPDLFDQIETDCGGVLDWHRIVYHVCTHDEDNPQPCSWDEKHECGDIPSDIPDFEVN